ncbi:hypothetical protein HispidOSU_014695, partial [Sigmodon hispidus]
QLSELHGLKKSWESCVDLMLTMQNLHRTLCNERPESVPLFSPYSEALYRILGHHPGPLYGDGYGTHPPLMNAQPSMDWPGGHGIRVPSAQLQGIPMSMMSQGDSLFPRWETWNSYPSSASNLVPPFDPEDPGLQQQP